MTPIPTLETERLILRPHKLEDVEVEAAFFATDRAQFVGGPKPPEDVFRAVAGILGHWQLRGYGFFAIEIKETGEYAGRAGPWFPAGWPEPEIGWTVMGEFEGKGIAYEAAFKAREYAYKSLGWSTAISLINPKNTRSAKLAERLGATLESDWQHPTYGHTIFYRHPARDALYPEFQP